MFENLVVVAIIIILLWVGAFVYYFYVSRQQNELEDEIEKLKTQLDKVEGED